jgi:DNA-binding transcriptional LysR family regulator
VRINPGLRLIVVGSPGYFAGRGVPRTPADLAEHTCVRNIYPSGSAYPWEFSRGGKVVEFEPTGPISLDDHELMVEAARSGVALAYVWEQRARPLIESGELVECLTAWRSPEEWLYLYYPARKYLSGGLRAVIEALRV